MSMRKLFYALVCNLTKGVPFLDSIHQWAAKKLFEAK